MSAYNPVISSVFLCLFSGIFAIEDYCSVNTFTTDESRMHFTKEASTDEYAVVGNFKGLHCCAKGYRSIEWLKDGKPYPWAGMVSQLILYPESANQTVYTQNIALEDSGNYTCLLKHDNVVYSHTIRLKVFDKVPDEPKITYVSGNTYAALGDSIRLFCEAFVGTVDLPDAHNEAKWSRTGYNESIHNDRVSEEKVSRENNHTTGTYLIIKNINRDDYGEYTCTITKPECSIIRPVYLAERVKVEYLNPNPFPWKGMMLFMIVTLMFVLSLMALNRRFGLPLRVKLKDKFGTLESDEGKINDVLIVYSAKDSEIITGVLIPVLESKYNYKCGSRELPANVNIWFTNLAEVSQKSRTILAALSPSCFEEKWDTNVLYNGVKQLQALGPRLTCVMLKPLPAGGEEVKNSQGETLSSVLSSVGVIRWDRFPDDQFWLSLRLRLPPMRRSGANGAGNQATQGDNSKRLSNDSQESLDNLV